MAKPFALIVEDDRDIVALFRHVLDIAGYQTEIVLDGKEAMARLNISRPDIVLLDLQLPGISGVEILQKMRANENLRDVPVVVITAYAFYSDNLPVEPDLLLLKPVDINQLSNLVQRLRTTHGELQEKTTDDITGLYSMPFFSVRLTFALERIKQTQFHRFGILFAETELLNGMKKEMDNPDFDAVLREMADRFKGTLRPTDTMAWSGDGAFLTLIEELPASNVISKIASRVKDGMEKHLEQNHPETNSSVRLGVLICDPEYPDSQTIIEDVEFMRKHLKGDATLDPLILDQEKLALIKN